MMNQLFATAETPDFVKKWEKNIAWNYLCMNPNNWAIDFMKQNVNKIDWKTICKNENQRIISELIEPFLLKRKLEIDFSELCRRPYAVDFFKSNPHLIDIFSLVENPNPEAILIIDHYLEYNKQDIPIQIVQNANAMHHVLRFYKNIIDLPYETADLFWYYLGANENPDAIRISMSNLDKINMELFSKNPGIKVILEWTDEMFDMICWNTFVFNPEFSQIIGKIERIPGNENQTRTQEINELLFDNVDFETLSNIPQVAAYI